jgi:hypothetical protein
MLGSFASAMLLPWKQLPPGLDFIWNVVTQWKIHGANVTDKSF